MGNISSINFKKSTDFQVFHNSTIRPNYVISNELTYTLNIADSMIYERRIYKKLIETGQSLKEFCKEDDKSLLEFKSLFSEILKITAQEKL